MIKQFIVALLFILSSFTGYSKNIVSDTYDSVKTSVVSGINIVDTSSNFKAIYTDVKTGIAALSSALKVGAEHVYTVLVKQQIVNSISNIILILIFFISSIMLYKEAGKKYTTHRERVKSKDRYDSALDQTSQGVGCILLNIGAAILFIATIGVFTNTYNSIISGIINPHYGAMKDIIEIVRPSAARN